LNFRYKIFGFCPKIELCDRTEFVTCFDHFDLLQTAIN
jgi:hypothetical protein